MMFFEVEIARDRCSWRNYKLNCYIKSSNNVFRSKQKTNKVPPNISRGFEVGTKKRFMF